MTYWMKELGAHHSFMCHTCPDEPLLVVFDIDDTILDFRSAVLHVLTSFDRHHGTRLFIGFTVDGLYGDENEFQRLIRRLPISNNEGKRVIDWCTRYFWSPLAIVEGHTPFPGVMEVIAWLQRQTNTFVGLNTGRPESMRKNTLDCLNRLGGPYGASFCSDLLCMNHSGEPSETVRYKAEGIRHFQRMGYRVVAFLDNEPENLQAVAALDYSEEILLMHAHTQFKSNPETLPKRAVRGICYDRDNLIGYSHLSHQALTLAQ